MLLSMLLAKITAVSNRLNISVDTIRIITTKWKEHWSTIKQTQPGVHHNISDRMVKIIMKSCLGAQEHQRKSCKKTWKYPVEFVFALWKHHTVLYPQRLYKTSLHPWGCFKPSVENLDRPVKNQQNKVWSGEAKTELSELLEWRTTHWKTLLYTKKSTLLQGTLRFGLISRWWLWQTSFNWRKETLRNVLGYYQ